MGIPATEVAESSKKNQFTCTNHLQQVSAEIKFKTETNKKLGKREFTYWPTQLPNDATSSANATLSRTPTISARVQGSFGFFSYSFSVEEQRLHQLRQFRHFSWKLPNFHPPWQLPKDQLRSATHHNTKSGTTLMSPLFKLWLQSDLKWKTIIGILRCASNTFGSTYCLGTCYPQPSSNQALLQFNSCTLQLLTNPWIHTLFTWTRPTWVPSSAKKIHISATTTLGTLLVWCIMGNIACGYGG